MSPRVTSIIPYLLFRHQTGPEAAFVLTLMFMTAFTDQLTSLHHHQQINPGMMPGNAPVTIPGSRQFQQSMIPNPGIAPRQVPMEIDLNEFMLDTDLDFLNRNFDIGSHY